MPHAVDRHRPLLRAHLEHAVVPLHSIDERPRLAGGPGERLLGVDVLACLAGKDAGKDPLKLARGGSRGNEHPPPRQGHLAYAFGGFTILRHGISSKRTGCQPPNLGQQTYT
jgi:hypothetical protein